MRGARTASQERRRARPPARRPDVGVAARSRATIESLFMLGRVGRGARAGRRSSRTDAREHGRRVLATELLCDRPASCVAAWRAGRRSIGSSSSWPSRSRDDVSGTAHAASPAPARSRERGRHREALALVREARESWRTVTAQRSRSRALVEALESRARARRPRAASHELLARCAALAPRSTARRTCARSWSRFAARLAAWRRRRATSADSAFRRAAAAFRELGCRSGSP